MLQSPSRGFARNLSVRKILLAAAAAAPIGLAGSAKADTYSWINPGADSWLNTANWLDTNTNTNALPSSADIALINSGGTSILDTNDNANALTLILGSVPTASGTFNISNGSLSVTDLRVGGADNGTGGAGTINQSGGVVSVGSMLFVGSSNSPVTGTASTAVGQYFLSAGVLAVGTNSSNTSSNPNLLAVGNGPGTTGIFTMTGGSLITSGSINIGRSGSSGTFLMNGGSLLTGAFGRNGADMLIGGNFIDPTNTTTGQPGTGYFEESGTQTIVHTSQNLVIGFGTTSLNGAGTYEMDGGSLISGGFIHLGRGTGSGTFLMNGGSVTTSGDLDMGSTSLSQTAKGYLKVTDGTFVVNNGNLNATTGTIQMNGGTLINQQNEPAQSGTNTFIYAVTAIGNVGPAIMTQSGGFFQVNNGSIDIGRGNGGIGSYTLSGGSISVIGLSTFTNASGNTAIDNNISIGGQFGASSLSTSTGTLEQDANTTIDIAAGSLDVGVGATGGAPNITGTFLMKGGQLTLDRSGAEIVVGNNAVGTVTQQGGVITLTSGSIEVGRVSGNGTYVISGGQLTANSITLPAAISGLTGGRLFDIAGGQVTVGSINLGTGSSTAIRSVNVDSGTLTVGTVILGQNGTFSLTGGSNLSIKSVSFVGGTMVSNGNVAIGTTSLNVTAPAGGNTGAGTVNVTGSANTLSTGSLVYRTSLAFTKNGPGTLSLNGPISSSTTAIISALNVTQGVLQIAAPAQTVSKLNTLNITSATGTALDLTNNDLVLDYSNTGTSPLSTIRSELKTGYHSGVWNGAGINSRSAATAASSAHKTAIGYAESSSLFSTFPATFNGASVNSQSVLLSYVYAGDANMDGTVNALDFNALASNYGNVSGNANWVQGDFDYDGTVGSNDFAILAANYNQGPAPSAALPDDASAAASLGAVVPEPVSMGMLGLVGGAMMLRRRKHIGL